MFINSGEELPSPLSVDIISAIGKANQPSCVSVFVGLQDPKRIGWKEGVDRYGGANVVDELSQIISVFRSVIVITLYNQCNGSATFVSMPAVFVSPSLTLCVMISLWAKIYALLPHSTAPQLVWRQCWAQFWLFHGGKFNTAGKDNRETKGTG